MTIAPRRILRMGLVIAHDGVMAALSFVAALALRLGDDPTAYSAELVTVGTVLFTAVAVSVFVTMQVHRAVWRYTSLPDIMQILRAVSLAILLFLLALFWVTRLEALPRSALVINWFVLVILMTGPRVLYRLIKDRGAGRLFSLVPARHVGRVPVLLVGAGDGTELFLRATHSDPDSHYRTVGILGTNSSRLGRRIRGVEVLGSLDDIDRVMDRLTREGNRPHRLIVTDPGIAGAPMRALLEKADALGVSLARLPRITDFRAGAPERVEPRPIDIADLLGRPQQVLDRDAMKALISGRRVLVTGAGGTIGGELARQIARLGPARLTLLDNAEFSLYSADLDVAEAAPELPREAVMADIRDRARIAEVIARASPDLVFHAAALKHVPIVEDHPADGALTNAVGTRNVADACRAAGVGAMVLISTDKAVNPSSVMGATKRIAESYCQALNLAREAGHGPNGPVGDTRFITVRFGNVLGSTGSVVPLFQRQLARGGPLTVTDPNMTRYFMTVREAVELVLEATVLGTAEDAGSAIFVLDMGEPVRIIELARQMIKLAGLEPERDVSIEITGPRPGEKITEELFHAGEATEPTRYPGVLIARPRAIGLEALETGLDDLEEAARASGETEVRRALAALAPDYAPPAEAEPARKALP